MYDALYAKLSDTNNTSKEENDHIGSKEVGGKTSKSNQSFQEINSNLFIIEEDLSNHREDSPDAEDANENYVAVSCNQCGRQFNFCSCRKNLINNQERSLQNGHAQQVEHDYDIPESIEPVDDDRWNESPKPFKINTCQSNFSRNNSRNCTNSLGRPLSSISSTSSSSSSNSLTRGQIGIPASYLASAESLEDIRTPDGETARRRDKGLKARREKALRAGKFLSFLFLSVTCNNLFLSCNIILNFDSFLLL